MMHRTFDLGRVTISFRVPPTTRDVLDYRVWVASFDYGVRQFYEACLWAAQWIVSPSGFQNAEILAGHVLSSDRSEEYVDADEERLAEGFENGDLLVPEFFRMCESMAASAALPDELLDGMELLFDQQNGIDPEWSPRPACPCPRCRRGNRDIPLPDGHHCIYEDAGQRIMDLVKHSADLSEQAAGEPYYMTQLRGVQRRAHNRARAHDREEREKKDREQGRTHEIYKRVLGYSGVGSG